GTSTTVLLDRLKGLLGPAVQQADLNRDGFTDLVVVNSGGNSVDTYFGSAGGLIDLTTKQSFFAGTNPVSVLIANVNGHANAIPDLVVANAGSNDVSILFGTGTTTGTTNPIAGWSTTPGPRLNAGQGPQSIILADVAHLVPDPLDPTRLLTVSGGDGKLDVIV